MWLDLANKDTRRIIYSEAIISLLDHLPGECFLSIHGHESTWLDLEMAEAVAYYYLFIYLCGSLIAVVVKEIILMWSFCGNIHMMLSK